MVEQVHPLRSDYVGTQIRRHPMSSHPLCHSSVQKHYQFFAFFSKNGNIFRYWPHRLTVRTSGFQSENRGSIPREVTRLNNDIIYEVVIYIASDAWEANRKTERDGASRGSGNFQQKIISDRFPVSSLFT